MNKVFKILTVCLATILMMTLLSVPALAKRPDGFNENRLWNKSSLGGEFILEIGDMAFRGHLTIAGGSEQFLDDMIEQVMDEMDLSESDLASFERFMDNLFGKQDMTDIDFSLISGNIGDELGISTNDLINLLGYIDKATEGDWYSDSFEKSVGDKILPELLNSDPSDASYDKLWEEFYDRYDPSGTMPESRYDALKEKLNDYLKTSGQDATDLFGKLSQYKEAYDKWQSYNPKDPDYKLAMDAFKRREEFYSRLNNKIEDALKDGDGKYYYAIVFSNAKDNAKFTLFGAQFTETWTLNMVLKMNGVGEHTSAWNPIAAGNSYAEFSGEYTIRIEYDLRDLPHQIRNMGDMGTRLSGYVEAGAMLGAKFAIEVIDGGDSLKRTLAGEATAQVQIYREGDGNYSISPNQNQDNIGGYDTTANLIATQTKNGTTWTLDWDLQFLIMDKDNLKLIALRNTVSAAGITLDGPLVSGETPLLGDIWDRGDKAGQGWTLRRW